MDTRVGVIGTDWQGTSKYFGRRSLDRDRRDWLLLGFVKLVGRKLIMTEEWRLSMEGKLR